MHNTGEGNRMANTNEKHNTIVTANVAMQTCELAEDITGMNDGSPW